MTKRPSLLDDVGKKLVAVRGAVALNLTPAVDIYQVLEEIEQGYLSAHLDSDSTSSEGKP